MFPMVLEISLSDDRYETVWRWQEASGGEIMDRQWYEYSRIVLVLGAKLNRWHCCCALLEVESSPVHGSWCGNMGPLKKKVPLRLNLSCSSALLRASHR